MISNVTSSLSPDPMPQTKNSDAYRRYTTFESTQTHKKNNKRLSLRLKSPLYSRKLHMRVRRARTSWVTSLTIFAFCLGGIVVNHFDKRTLPIDVNMSIRYTKPALELTSLDEKPVKY